MKFYDSAVFSRIPEDAGYAALYADGRYAVTASEDPRRIRHRRWITVTGDTPHAGIADYEHLNPVHDIPGKLRVWAMHRIAEHRSMPIIYCDRADLHSAIRELGSLPCAWWIPTLDDHEWSAMELSADIETQEGLHIPDTSIWANQYTDNRGEYDISNLFGNWHA